MRVSVTFINRFMPGLTSAFRIGWGLSSWLLYVHVKFELLMVLRWYCVNTLESYNFIDVYIIWATLEALFLPFRIQFTTKRCQNALMYKKIFIFLNQMILNLFTTIWLTSKDPKTSFGTCGLRGGRVRRGSTVDWLPMIVWLRFSASFFKVFKSLFQPQSFECI